MKKLLILALVLAMLAFCLTACDISDILGEGSSEGENEGATGGEGENGGETDEGKDENADGSGNESVDGEDNKNDQNSDSSDDMMQGAPDNNNGNEGTENGTPDSGAGEGTNPGVSGGSDGNDGEGDVDEGDDIVVNTNVELAFSDVTIATGIAYPLSKTVTVNGVAKELTYTVDSDKVSVSDYKLVAAASVRKATVTAEADGFVATLTVKAVNVGELVMSDVSLSIGETVALAPSFTSAAGESDITYSFEGENIKIENGSVTALVADSVTLVTATSAYHKATFTVTVLPDSVGKMTVSAPSRIYSNYAPKDIVVSFSDARYASDVTFTCSTPNVFVENGKIWAEGDFAQEVSANIVVKSKYHTETVTVKVSEFVNGVNAEKKIAYYETLMTEENKGGIIFIGDSYFDGYPGSNGLPPFWSDFYTDYADEKAFLMGISSSQIDTWEVAIDRVVFPMEPKEIVFHIGFNDAHHSGNSAYNIATRIIAVLERIHEKLPDTKIYYCSVEPKKNALTNNQFYTSSMVKAPMINAIMEAYAIDNSGWVKFVNTSKLCFKADGSIDQSFYLSTDLSHPTIEAYEKYRTLIEIARGNIEGALTPAQTVEAIKSNQSAVTSAASSAKAEATDTVVLNHNDLTTDITGNGKTFKLANGSNLSNYYSISGYIDVTSLKAANNPHIQFRFGSSRFLFWDSDKNGKFGLGGDSGEAAYANAFDATAGTITIKWQIVFTESTAYWYVNDTLVSTIEGIAPEYFNIGCLGCSIEIYGVELVAKSENESGYNSIIEKLKLS